MKNRVLTAGLVSGLALGVGVAVAGPGHDHGHDRAAAKNVTRALPKCPVSGEPVNFAVRVAAEGGPVFFCCKDCVAKYEANPVKYASQVKAQHQALAQRPRVQVNCAVSGKLVDTDVFIENNKERIYFCCKGCINKFEANPAKYRVALANSYTYQTKCPVMGGEIDPQARTGKVFFCCGGCDKKFFNDPAEYAPNLEAQGFKYDAAEMKHGAGQAENAPHGKGAHDHDGHGHDH